MKQKRHFRILSAIFLVTFLLLFIASPLRAQWNTNNFFSQIYTSSLGNSSTPFTQSQNTLFPSAWSAFNVSSQPLFPTISQIANPLQQFQYPTRTTYNAPTYTPPTYNTPTYNTPTTFLTSNLFTTLSTNWPTYSSPYSFPTSPLFTQIVEEEEKEEEEEIVFFKKEEKIVYHVKSDDWQYDARAYSSSVKSVSYTSGFSGYPSGAIMLGGSGGGGMSAGYSMAYSTSVAAAPNYAASTSSAIGFSTGGANDINNFRANIENDYFPILTDITYEGLFYDYYFDTGQTEECDELFCPSYTAAISMAPFSDEEEYYMSVGLNSGMDASEFHRKKLNLVVVLDISGSMSSSFDQYYYDRFGNRQVMEYNEDSGKSKMQIANESIVGLLDHLNDDDRFGMVVFETQAHLAKPLNLVGNTDMKAIKDHIRELSPTGGTQMSAGMREGTSLFEEYLNVDPTVYENRIIFLTDAMPNLGETSESGLLGMMKKNANNKIYSTFIGIGVDFNTELVEYITKIRGANYYSVHSSSEFKDRMDRGFEFMVTPLVFNLSLKLKATGFEIEKVYGSPEADEATGELMKVNTLFPSDASEYGTKGGVILLNLRRTSNADPKIILSVSYEDREGNMHSNEENIDFPDHEPEFFDNTGIRKAILLSRYINLIANWIIDERRSRDENKPIETYITYEDGIACRPCPCFRPPCPCCPPIPPIYPAQLGKWERQSVPLSVSSVYRAMFKDFKDYFTDEMEAIGDSSLAQEVTILEKLSTYTD
ncbi:MAG: vWA domain-containing protein [bacterium]